MHNDWNEYYFGILRKKRFEGDETIEHELARLLDYVSRESVNTFPGEELRITGESDKPDFIVKGGLIFMFYDKRFDPDQATLKRFLKMKALKRDNKMDEFCSHIVPTTAYDSIWNNIYSDILIGRIFHEDETQEYALAQLLGQVSRGSRNRKMELCVLGVINPDFMVKNGQVYMAYDSGYDVDRITLKRFLKMKKMQHAVMGS